MPYSVDQNFPENKTLIEKHGTVATKRPKKGGAGLNQTLHSPTLRFPYQFVLQKCAPICTTKFLSKPNSPPTPL